MLSDLLRSEQLDSSERSHDLLAELNVVESVSRMAETPLVRRAWERGLALSIHGLVYGLKDALPRNLDCTISHGNRS